MHGIKSAALLLYSTSRVPTHHCCVTVQEHYYGYAPLCRQQCQVYTVIYANHASEQLVASLQPQGDLLT